MIFKNLNIIFLIFLLLVLLVVRSLSDCHFSSSEKIDCSYASLVQLPKLGRDLKIFNASHNRIPHLKRDSFYRLVKVGQVVSDLSGLRTINQYIFTGQSQLEVIDLSWNLITFVHPIAFVFCSKLKWLSLAYNSALRLPENGLFALGKSLRVLYMNHCNISNINENTFKMGKHDLQELYLDHNAIMTVHDNAFASFKMLQILDLSKNRIKYFHINIVSPIIDLHSLNLQNNPLEWNCTLQALHLWSNVQKIKLSNVTCRTSDDNFLDASELMPNMKRVARSIRTRRDAVADSGPETKSSDNDSSLVLIIIGVLVAVVVIVFLCACLLSNTHECTEAAGCLLIWHQCYQ